MGYHDQNANFDEAELEGANILVGEHKGDPLDIEKELLNEQVFSDSRQADGGDKDGTFTTSLDAIDVVNKVANTFSSELFKMQKKVTVKAIKMPPLYRKRAQQVIDILKAIHKMVDPQLAIEATRSTLTYANNKIDPDKISDYITVQANNESIIQYNNQHPDQIDALSRQNARAFATEMFMYILQPK
ncbi:hypothetical protein FPOAC2_03899 [Fusarium poae]|jgi:hypothetical protein